MVHVDNAVHQKSCYTYITMVDMLQVQNNKIHYTYPCVACIRPGDDVLPEEGERRELPLLPPVEHLSPLPALATLHQFPHHHPLVLEPAQYFGDRKAETEATIALYICEILCTTC